MIQKSMGRKPRLGSAGADDSDVCQEPREARGDGDEYSCRPEHVPPVPERERARARERESASERESRHPPSPIEREGGGGGERERAYTPRTHKCRQSAVPSTQRATKNISVA